MNIVRCLSLCTIWSEYLPQLLVLCLLVQDLQASPPVSCFCSPSVYKPEKTFCNAYTFIHYPHDCLNSKDTVRKTVLILLMQQSANKSTNQVRLLRILRTQPLVMDTAGQLFSTLICFPLVCHTSCFTNLSHNPMRHDGGHIKVRRASFSLESNWFYGVRTA